MSGKGEVVMKDRGEDELPGKENNIFIPHCAVTHKCENELEKVQKRGKIKCFSLKHCEIKKANLCLKAVSL